MLLAMDIGNTTISLGVMRGKKIIDLWHVYTAQTERQLISDLQKVLAGIKKRRYLIRDIIICSVVPRALGIVKPFLQKRMGIKVFVVGQDIKVPIKNNYRYPKQVGQDRLVGAYAAKVLYGAPLIVVDFGTAITFDIVSKKGEYLGGIIVPGIRLTAESLFKKTALLPKVEIERPKELIGRDTKNSILSGIFYGYGSLCDGLIILINKKLKLKSTVIATGGYVNMMKQFSREIGHVDQGLIFRGLYLIYQKGKES